MAWEKGNPVNFAVDGDTTAEAIEKFMAEFTSVYEFLNRLRNMDMSTTAPSDPEVSALWVDTSGAVRVIKYYTGTVWSNLIEITAIEGLSDALDALDTGKVAVADVINTLVSTETAKPLSANMGKTLKDTADTLATLVALMNTTIVPTGSVTTFSTLSVPTDFLECDGSAIDRTTYADLYTVIGTSYGVGDGSTTFNIPDLRGEFIRGADNGRGIDSGRAIASSQADEYKTHSHNSAGRTSDSGWASGGVGNAGTSGTTVTTNNLGGTETRPRNIAMMFCIKY